jgi:hypothetical protein
MSPTTHLLASWIIAAKTTDNLRDRRLVALAGVAPDVDGLGLAADIFNAAVFHKHTEYYQLYHHYIAHGLPGALLTAGVFACLARRRVGVFFLSFLTFHLHLLCDLLGSRGPEVNDKWPIFYLAPFRLTPMWIWKGQWPLFGWQNLTISLILFAWAMAISVEKGDSIIGVFSQKADAVFVATLRRWFGKTARQPV